MIESVLEDRLSERVGCGARQFRIDPGCDSDSNGRNRNAEGGPRRMSASKDARAIHRNHSDSDSTYDVSFRRYHNLGQSEQV